MNPQFYVCNMCTEAFSSDTCYESCHACGDLFCDYCVNKYELKDRYCRDISGLRDCPHCDETAKKKEALKSKKTQAAKKAEYMAIKHKLKNRYKNRYHVRYSKPEPKKDDLVELHAILFQSNGGFIRQSVDYISRDEEVLLTKFYELHKTGQSDESSESQSDYENQGEYIRKVIKLNPNELYQF